ncbi:MAG: galactokinase [Bacteroidetes bacterium 4484_249]|nr:MAG: galactokinase [Bacteroidetes bacterium 4484_249]
MNISELKQKFNQLYGEGKEKIYIFFAPGRLNLIGEHTDYNGGYVLPCSLQYGTYLLIRKTTNPAVKFKSLNFVTTAQVCMKNTATKIGNTWINYPLGVIKEFQTRDFKIPGMELLFAGDIPNGAGLSSSASVEMVTAFALNKLLESKLNILELIKLSQHAENDFVGMKCGILDQFAVGMGKKDEAVFLNCDTLDYEMIPFVLKDYSLIISNTNKRRELADSKYNERRMECEKAVEYLSKNKTVKNLSELSLDEFESVQNVIPDTVVRKRAYHVISENQRVLDAVEALKAGKPELFGKLMYGSHKSLKNDYEVSCTELDALVEEAAKVKGVIGSRMTGGGFGGCTVSIVDKNSIETFINEAGKNYFDKTGLKADFYIAEIGDGVKEINV